MPIEVDIPIEISSYKKKVIFGLTLRQLVTLPIAILVSALSFSVLVTKLRMTIDSASWFIMLLALPPLAIGFLQPNGEPFERWFIHRLQRLLQPQKLYYYSNITINEKEVTSRVLSKKTHQRSYSRSESVWICTVNRKSGNRRRKEIAKRLKADQKAYRRAKKK